MSSHLRSRLRSPHFLQAVAGVLVVVSAVCSPPASARADDAANKPPVKSSANDDLARRQERIASKYAQLEELMLRMAQLEAAQNPRRAALLNQALGKSKDSHTKLQLETIATLLGKRQLSRAVKEQVDAEKSLEDLLKLLQSEDRSERLKTEQERIKEYIKEVERMIRIQRSIQGQNEGGGDAKRIADEQNKLAQRAEDLADKIKQNEEGASESPEAKSGDENKEPNTENPSENPSEKNSEKNSEKKQPGESEPGESPSGNESKSGEQPAEKKESDAEQKPGENPQEQKSGEGEKPAEKPGEPKPKEGGKRQPQENKPSESQPNETQPGESQPQESKPGSEKPSEGKPSESNKPPQSGDMPPGEQGEQSPSGEPSQQQENPVRQKIQEAQQRMKAAEQKLQEAKRKESVEEQQKAREELEKAKAELEKILKQLREEEMERTLQALEGRFRKMLEMQVKVYEGTKKLDAIPAEDRTRELDVQAGRLGGDEAKIAVEAEKALQLLEEEGSSVAFPATVDLLVDDMRQTADRLNQGKVDSITQGLEEEIIASLEELLQALEQAQQKLEEQKQQQQPPPQQPQGGQQSQPLVDAIQELKMIKSLQLRVNKRTDRYAKLLKAEEDPVGQANTQDLLDALDKLGERQKQVFEIVREIVLGRNK